MGVQKCVTDERCPHHGRHVHGHIGASRLVIEMVPPACPTVACRLVFQQPLQRKLSSVSPCGITCGCVKPYKAPSQKTHALGGMALGNPQQRAQVDRKPTYPLL